MTPGHVVLLVPPVFILAALVLMIYRDARAELTRSSIRKSRNHDDTDRPDCR